MPSAPNSAGRREIAAAKRRARRTSDDFRAIAAEGLSQFAWQLKQLELDNPKVLNELNEQAGEWFIRQAQRKARRVGPQQAAAAKTMKAAKQARRVKINLPDRKPSKNDSKSPNIGRRARAFALGAEFGAYPRTARDGHRYNRFRPWGGNQHIVWKADGPGYFLYPTIRDERDQLIEWYDDALARMVSDIFPNARAR